MSYLQVGRKKWQKGRGRLLWREVLVTQAQGAAGRRERVARVLIKEKRQDV